MTAPSHPPGRNGSKHRFAPLTQDDFLRLEHAPSLKGLLKPFKGKGLESWASDVQSLRDGLMGLGQEVLAQANSYPFHLLPIVLTRQSTGAGTTFLRWRNADRSAMGVGLWNRLVESPATPVSLLDDLLALELQRAVLNMQISLMHTITRQARECAQKMAQAEAVYQRRLSRHETQEAS